MFLILGKSDAVCNWLSGKAPGDIAQFAGTIAVWIESIPVLGNANVQNGLTVASVIAFAISGLMVWWPQKTSIQSAAIEAVQNAIPQTPIKPESNTVNEVVAEYSKQLDDILSIAPPPPDLRLGILQSYFVQFLSDMEAAASGENAVQGGKASEVGRVMRRVLADLPMKVERLCGTDERNKFSRELANTKRRVPKHEVFLVGFVFSYLQSLIIERHLVAAEEVDEHYQRKISMISEIEANLHEIELEIIRKMESS